MSSDRFSMYRFSHLLHKLVYGQIMPQEFAQLEQALMQEPKARELYREFISVHVGLYGPGGVVESIRSDARTELEPAACMPNAEPENVRQIEQYAKQQLEAFLAEQQRLEKAQEKASRRPDVDVGAVLYGMGHRIEATVRFLARSTVRVAAAVVVLLAIAGVVQYVRAHRVVATLGQTLHAQWERSPDTNDLRPGWLSLQQGFARLNFKNGAQVVVQAPCRFRLISEKRMECLVGSVSVEASGRARGFAIETPSSCITDFGTAFGVFVDAQENSDIHVFDGEVGVQSSVAGRGTRPTTLTRGQNARTDDAAGVQVGKAGCQASQFARDLPDPAEFGIPGRRISLADIVGGGNGFGTGVPDHGIDMLTGEPMIVDRTNKMAGGPDYIAVPSNPYVDGVFVPDGGQGPVQVSSTGIRFAECPDTNGGIYGHVFYGAWFIRPEEPEVGRYYFCQNGKEYGSSDAAVSMHSNIGITFDLQAVRKDQPGLSLKRFSARCGISQFRPEKTEVITKATFWVLVDGVKRFEYCATFGENAVPMEIELGRQDRFLTVMVTDTDGQDWDWTFLMEPALELESPQSPARDAPRP
jgi:hypothetical protein